MHPLWVVGGAAVLLGVAVAVHWFFFDTGPSGQPDYDKIRGWRERKAEATSYGEMAEYRDSIKEEYEKAGRRGETAYQRLLRWWTS